MEKGEHLCHSNCVACSELEKQKWTDFSVTPEVRVVRGILWKGECGKAKGREECASGLFAKQSSPVPTAEAIVQILTGLCSPLSLYNENILTQRTIACPVSFNMLLSELKLAARTHKSEISQVPGFRVYIYHLSVFAGRKSERAHICLYKIFNLWNVLDCLFNLSVIFLEPKVFPDILHDNSASIN